MKPDLITALFLSSLASGCSGETEVSATPTDPPAQTATTTPAQAITNLETAGSIPSLDRTSSIPGTDYNGNGVRDDVENWINRQSVTAQQKKALTQHAKALQAEITADATDSTAVTRTGIMTMRSVHCIFSRFTGAAALRTTEDLKRITFNTKARFIAATKMSSAASGSVISMPQEDTCDE